MREVTTIDAIDGSFIPRPRPDVVVIEAGQEKVLIRGNPYALNQTAALVWGCFDGDVTLDKLIAELTRASGADEETIRSDVVGLTRELASIGVFEGFPPGSGAAPKQPPTRGVEVGNELATFVLPDLDDNQTRWESFRRRQILLVSWNPTCGFCTRIADELAALQKPLEEWEVSLVFVTRGSPDANRAVFEKHGIDAVALLGNRDGPFAGFGTPAAYLVDGEGKVAAPFAYGALEVPRLARQAAGVDDDAPGGEPTRARYLPAAAAVCGGGESGQTNGANWTGTAAYRFGEFHVGIRYNAESSAETLDRLFAGLRVEDSRVPDNFSVVLQDRGGRTRELNLLLRGAKHLVRSRARARVLRGLLNHLSADLTTPEQPLFGLRTSAVVRDGRATVLPASVSSWLNNLQPRLNRSGIQVVDVPWVMIDPVPAELVVPEPSVDYDPGVLHELDGTDRLGAELPPVLPGRYPLGAWIMPARRDAGGPLTPARAVVEAVPLLMVPRDGVKGAAQALVGLFERVEPNGAWLDSPSVLMRLLQLAG